MKNVASFRGIKHIVWIILAHDTTINVVMLNFIIHKSYANLFGERISRNIGLFVKVEYLIDK